MQLRCRFKGLEQIVSTYECINPEVLVSKDDDYLHNQAHNLTDIYNSDISAYFPNQLHSFRRLMKKEIMNIGNATIKGCFSNS